MYMELVFFFVVFAINLIVFKSLFAEHKMSLFPVHNHRDKATVHHENVTQIGSNVLHDNCDKHTDIRIVLKNGRTQCICKYPLIYAYDKNTGQCNKLIQDVCEGGTLDKNNTTPRCVDCPVNTESRIINGVPKCVPIDFKRSIISGEGVPGMVKISNSMISAQFRKNFTIADNYIKNPCEFDAITGKFLHDGRSGVSTDGVYYCIPGSSSVVSVRADDDYLTGNNGAYANGIISISYKPAVNVIVEWLDENNIIIGYRYKTSDIHKHILDKFDFSDAEYINIYNAPIPASGNDIPYPFLDRNAIFKEIASDATPKPAGDEFLMHYVLVGNESVPLVSCDKLGTPDVDLKIDPNLNYSKYIFDGTRDSLRDTGYIVCKRPRTPGTIDFIPNTKFKDFTGVISIDSKNVINPAWYGTPEQLVQHKKIHFNI